MKNGILNYLQLTINIIRSKLHIVFLPSFITFFVTWRCNHRCIMCDFWKNQNRDEMSLTQIENIFRQLRKLDVIRLTGGEPFLRRDLAEIVNIIQKNSHPTIIHITSNGFLTDIIHDTLNRVDELSHIHLKISIDALEGNHDRIRGTRHAWKKAFETLFMLRKFKKKVLFLGVNQTIVDRTSIEDCDELKKICDKLEVPLLLQIAYDDSILYKSEKNISSLPKTSGEFSTFYDFKTKELDLILDRLSKEINTIPDRSERIIKKYYLKGLRNRLLYGKPYPNPSCVELCSHLRILPDGLVPVCLYDSTIVGDLTKIEISGLLNSKEVKQARDKIKKCKGCWAECEVVPNGIYMGDFIKAFIG